MGPGVDPQLKGRVGGLGFARRPAPLLGRPDRRPGRRRWHSCHRWSTRRARAWSSRRARTRRPPPQGIPNGQGLRGGGGAGFRAEAKHENGIATFRGRTAAGASPRPSVRRRMRPSPGAVPSRSSLAWRSGAKAAPSTGMMLGSRAGNRFRMVRPSSVRGITVWASTHRPPAPCVHRADWRTILDFQPSAKQPRGN